MLWIDLLGYAASVSVLATFCMNAMVPLRILALCSNVLFVGYGYFDHLYPVLILHLILFPVNVLRLLEFQLRKQGKLQHSNSFIVKSISASGQKRT